MEIMKLAIKEDFNCGTCFLFSFSCHKITLFEKKYVIKLITLAPMHHLKPLVSLQVHLKAHCHSRISYDHTKSISQVYSKNVGTSVEVSFHLTEF